MTNEITLRAWTRLALASAALVVSVTGCKKPDANARRGARTVKAAIAEFDPNFELNLDKWGSKRVDDWLVQEAFNRSFEGMDRCIAEYKQRKGIPEDRTLGGDADFEVKLNPKKPRPFAVNAKLSDSKLGKEKELRDCLREVVAEVGFPTYDGPPQVAVFSIQPLDAGYAWED